jgi:hypothetical protein
LRWHWRAISVLLAMASESRERLLGAMRFLGGISNVEGAHVAKHHHAVCMRVSPEQALVRSKTPS